MVNGIGQVGMAWIAGSVACGLLSHVVRALRWGMLLVGGQTVSTASLVSATFIGVMANNLLPARLGEVVRAWVLARREQRSISTVLASILVERLLDVIVVLAVLGLCLAVTPDLGMGATSLLKQTGLVVLLLVAAGVAGLLIAVRLRARLLRVGERWGTQPRRAWASRGLELLRGCLDGLCVLRGGSQAVSVAGLSLLVWATAIASFHLLAEGFDLGLTLVQTTLVLVIVLFGIAIPSAPGFVGTFHGFCVAGLVMVAGIEPTRAATYATLLHGSHWLAMNLVGIGCLLVNRSLTWAGVTSLAKRA
jgi:hypothetical protein